MVQDSTCIAPTSQSVRNDAHFIIDRVIEAVLPEPAVRAFLRQRTPPPRVTLIAIGKAAWRMASAAVTEWGDAIAQGVVITKYHHALGELPNLEIYEAGHPLLDANGLHATQRALALVDELGADDTVLFLVSGGGSALFEALPDGVTLDDLQAVNAQLLRSGADIVAINTIRKRLSLVKGGRFAQRAAPARILALVISDVLGDRLDTIASGPAYPDATTAETALAIARHYQLHLSPMLWRLLEEETPKTLDNVETHVIGSVRAAVAAATQAAQARGYTSLTLTTLLNCEAREAGRFLAAVARTVRSEGLPLPAPCAILCGGETVVTVTGAGKGGRNQELALSAAIELAGMDGVVLASLGTDGTDGPTDAAGGIIDGDTTTRMAAQGIDARSALADNNAYPALAASGDLLITGPTGANVNDVTLLLVR
ncbi:MAG: D-glycerate 2-kinase [Chloroflexota bacterium]|nr:MAG: D-glycerate 2-kinase [Chloroflexota bacterium]